MQPWGGRDPPPVPATVTSPGRDPPGDPPPVPATVTSPGSSLPHSFPRGPRCGQRTSARQRFAQTPTVKVGTCPAQRPVLPPQGFPWHFSSFWQFLCWACHAVHPAWGSEQRVCQQIKSPSLTLCEIGEDSGVYLRGAAGPHSRARRRCLPGTSEVREDRGCRQGSQPLVYSLKHQLGPE